MFVHQWFQNEVAQLTLARREALGIVTGVVSMEQLLDRFELLAALLSGEMLKANVLDVVFEVGASDGVWRSVRDVADAWIVDEAVVYAGAGLAGADKRRATASATVAALAAIEELRATCPLRRSGDSLQFMPHGALQLGASIVQLQCVLPTCEVGITPQRNNPFARCRRNSTKVLRLLLKIRLRAKNQVFGVIVDPWMIGSDMVRYKVQHQLQSMPLHTFSESC